MISAKELKINKRWNYPSLPESRFILIFVLFEFQKLSVVSIVANFESGLRMWVNKEIGILMALQIV